MKNSKKRKLPDLTRFKEARKRHEHKEYGDLSLMMELVMRREKVFKEVTEEFCHVNSLLKNMNDTADKKENGVCD